MTDSDFKDSVLGYLNKKAVLAKENADSYRNICNDEMAVGNTHRAEVAFKAWSGAIRKAQDADELIEMFERNGLLRKFIIDGLSDSLRLMYSQACAYAKAQ